MARSFDLSADFEDNVEEVHRAFTEEEYWRARLAHIPVDEWSLDSLRIEDDGTVEVTTLQVVHSQHLHALFKQFHRGDICIRRSETWGPVTDGTSTASITGSVDGAPVHVTGTAVLTGKPESAGSQLECRLAVKVRIPLIGGKLEKIIGTQLATLVAQEQEFTTTWITNNA